ncbi:WD40 repeat domain-containing protein, partial [Kitasatospora putterlickiae]|uniref:WD40 repeat domain-containing protein n=1 Tax=Kitasatospora putterlickiae TaxID=221725 RepID=UPI0031D4E87D
YRAAATPEARGALLASALQPVQTRLTGHTAFVVGLAFNRTGRTLASAAADGSVRIWNTSDRYHPSPGEVLEARGNAALAWHPDGNHLLVHTSADLSVWDLADPSRPRLVSRAAADAGAIAGLAVSPDGSTLAVAAGGGLRLWDLHDLSRPDPVPPVPAAPGSEAAPVDSVSFHPDGRTLALTVSGGRVRILDVADRAFPRPLAEPGGTATLSVAFSPDGRRLVGGGGGAGDGLHLWDTSDPAKPIALPDPAPGQETNPSLSFPGREPVLATVSRAGRLTLTRIDDKPAAARVVPGGSGLLAAAYAPDGRTVAGGDENGVVTLWNAPVQSLPEALAGRLDLGEPVFSADGRYGVGRSGTIWRIDRDGPPVPVGSVPGATGEVRFLQGRDVLVGMAGPERLRLWSFADGTARPAGEIPLPEALTGRPVVGASPGSTVIAVYNGTPPYIYLWDIQQVHHPVRLATIPDQYPNTDTRLTLFGEHGRRLAVIHGTQFRILDLTDPANSRQLALVRTQPRSLDTSGDNWLIVSREVIAGEEPHRPNTAWAPGAEGEADRLDAGPRLGDTARFVRGRTVVALSDLGQPFLADLEDPGKRHALPGGLSRVTSLAVGPAAGALVAWGSTDPTGAPLALWRPPADGAPPGSAELIAQTRVEHSGLVLEGFRPGDGALLLGLPSSPLALLGGESVLVPTDFDRLRQDLCAVRTVRYGRAEWANTFSDLPYADPCA